eukprot:GDKI01010573.1.p1 GENE.GDKI01010573.1~~GDKI01010573.1.p1  ORF type:complete len:315 (-),score=45.05 GDKI01010573.1:23-967(-)
MRLPAFLCLIGVLCSSVAAGVRLSFQGHVYVHNKESVRGEKEMFPIPMYIGYYPNTPDGIGASVSVKDMYAYYRELHGSGLNVLKERELDQILNANGDSMPELTSYRAAYSEQAKYNEEVRYNLTKQNLGGKEVKLLMGQEAKEWIQHTFTDSYDQYKLIFQAMDICQRIMTPRHLLASILDRIVAYKEDKEQQRENKDAMKYQRVERVENGLVKLYRRYAFKVPNDSELHYTKGKWKYTSVGAHTGKDNGLVHLYTPIKTVTVLVTMYNPDLDPLYETEFQLKELVFYSAEGDHTTRFSEDDKILHYIVENAY